MPLDMEASRSLTHRKTHRVRGPRPFSWLSSSSDSSPNEYQDWPWYIRTHQSVSPPRSSSPTESSDSSSSSSSSHPAHPLDTSRGKLYYRHGRRRRPAGPRAPRDGSYFDVRRLALWVNTTPSVIPHLHREDSPIRSMTPADSAHMFQPTRVPPLTIHSPTNFPLDWDAIFELLGCSEEVE